jgi:hypothetical protein
MMRNPPIEISTSASFTSGSVPIPSTPIAAALYDHFARGGTIEEGLRLVEALERVTTKPRSRPKEPVARGSRLSAAWEPSAGDISFAVARGMTPTRITNEAEKFKNYWSAKSGSGAIKCDWAACWRNWIIKAGERNEGRDRGNVPRTNFDSRRAATGSDAVMAGMARLARRIDERGTADLGGGRQIPFDANAAGQLDLEPDRTR